jgi:hypothetical protein
MKKGNEWRILLGLVPLALASCGQSGFSYEYGWGAVAIELTEMRLTERTDYQFETLDEPIAWGRYLEYEADYTNIAYYWQELPHHHYYFNYIPSKPYSPYLNGRAAITCDAATIEREATVHCSYLVLVSTAENYDLEGDNNIFVTNAKLENLTYITVTVTHWKISLRS